MTFLLSGQTGFYFKVIIREENVRAFFMDEKLTNLLFAFLPQELIIVACLQRKAFDIVSF